MKNIRPLFVCILIFTYLAGYTQEKGTEELKMGYGIITSTQIAYDISDIFATAFTLGSITYDDERSMGALYINYNYSISDKFTLGALVNFEQITNKVLSSGNKIGNTTAGYYTFAVEAAFRYVRKDKFQMYSGLGLAYTYGTIKFESTTAQEDDWSSTAHLPNFQITGVGLRYGTKFGGFIEFGFGYKGLVNAGLSFQM